MRTKLIMLLAAAALLVIGRLAEVGRTHAYRLALVSSASKASQT
jgi:hypothetical protein